MWTFPTEVIDSQALWLNLKDNELFVLQKYNNDQVKSMWATFQNVFETRLAPFRILIRCQQKGQKKSLGFQMVAVSLDLYRY